MIRTFPAFFPVSCFQLSASAIFCAAAISRIYKKSIICIRFPSIGSSDRHPSPLHTPMQPRISAIVGLAAAPNLDAIAAAALVPVSSAEAFPHNAQYVSCPIVLFGR
jgi:hypothetical protein